MLSVFDEILDVLSDGGYHTIEDIDSKTHLNMNQIEFALSFLEQYGFIRRLHPRWSTRTRKAILTNEMLNFLKRLKELEGAV